MPNFASLIRHEVRRLARKETRAVVSPLRKQITSLRRRVAEQQQLISELERASKRAASAAAVAAASRAGDDGATESGPHARFSPSWMRRHRARLGMSRENYAKLLGVSAQSVLVWETGRSRPRQRTIDAWAQLRQMRVRDIRHGIAPVGGKDAKPAGRAKPAKTARRAKPTRRAKPARRAKRVKRAKRRRITARGARRKASSKRKAGRRR